METCLDGPLHPDNLSFARNGDLLVAGQVGALRTGLHIALHSGIAVKSAVVRVPTSATESDGTGEIYAQSCSPDLVQEFEGAAAISEVVVHGDHQFLGQVVGDYIGVNSARASNAEVKGASDALALSEATCVDAISGDAL
jgi:hypothetical protein